MYLGQGLGQLSFFQQTQLQQIRIHRAAEQDLTLQHVIHLGRAHKLLANQVFCQCDGHA